MWLLSFTQVNSRRASKCTSHFHSQVNCTSKIVLAKRDFWLSLTSQLKTCYQVHLSLSLASQLHLQDRACQTWLLTFTHKLTQDVLASAPLTFTCKSTAPPRSCLPNVTVDFRSQVTTNVLSKCTPKNVQPKCTVKFISEASSLLSSSHSGQACHCGTSLFVVQYSPSCEPDTASWCHEFTAQNAHCGLDLLVTVSARILSLVLLDRVALYASLSFVAQIPAPLSSSLQTDDTY